ncbi:MAG: copper resistance CopC family protein [candidate division NC10 bacterium]|jgi:methionine-rich copper-binding protein CopC
MHPGGVLRAGALLLALASPAAAHSLLLESAPAAGSTVAGPRQLTVRFNNRIEKPLSRLRLVNERGEAQPLAAPASDGPADRLTVGLPALSPGAYRVEWQVLSTDGHIVSGGFSFRVAP